MDTQYNLGYRDGWRLLRPDYSQAAVSIDYENGWYAAKSDRESNRGMQVQSDEDA